MADKPISQFPAASSVNASDVLAGVQDGVTKKFSFAVILAWLRTSLANLFVPTSRTVNSKALSADITLDASDVGAYELPSGGIPKSDLAQGVQDSLDAADSAYQLPSGGMPSSDMASAVQTSLGKADTAYQKPSAGIPSADMASAVQTSLGKADTAYQKPSSGIPASDLASGVIPTVPAISTATPQMDGTGAAGSTGEVSDAGHVHPTDTSRAPVYGLGHNLLDNWYFVGGGSQQGGGKLPINQRGMTTYTGNGYHLDRWINYNNPTLTVAANGVTVSASNAAGYANLMRQSIADPAKYRGVTLTASAMIEDSTADVYLTINDGVAHASGRSVAGTNLLKVTWTVGDSASALSVNMHNWTAGANPSFRLIAAKLEIGTEQTLAHQEGGSWVLNEIPNYEAELLKCQTSTADSTDNYAGMIIGTEQQIAKPQTGNTANRKYNPDDCFCWNGLIFRATTTINNGATLTVNTNCVQTTVMDELVRLTT